jgi:hypothetical protein
LIVGISRVEGRIRKSGAIAQQVQDEINRILKDDKFFEKAPFERVFLTFYYDRFTNLQPCLEGIDTEFNELPVSCVLGIEDMKSKPIEEIERQFYKGALKALLSIANLYGLPSDRLSQHLSAL